MPSSVGHALVAITAAAALARPAVSRRFAVAVAIGAVLPDLDAIGRPFGRGDLPGLGGHRALTHSLTFALVLGVMIGALVQRATGAWWRRAMVASLAVATHGVLDAMTTYGGGVAFFAPWSWARYKFAWTPLTGVLPEVVLLWLPAICLLWWAPFARDL